MSRTYKDRPWRVRRLYDHDRDVVYLSGSTLVTRVTQLNLDTMEFETAELEEPYVRNWFRRLESKTTKPKQRKAKDTEYHWMSTPSWFHRIFNNVPQRRRGRAWERKVLLEDLDETDPPRFSKRPEKYYW